MPRRSSAARSAQCAPDCTAAGIFCAKSWSARIGLRARNSHVVRREVEDSGRVTMPTDDPVRRALADLAEADASRRAPPHLERAVINAFDRQRERGHLSRWAATVWDHRRAVVAMTAAVSVTITIYFKVLDRVSVHPPVTEPSLQSLAGLRPEPPGVLGQPEQLESPVTPSPSVTRPRGARREAQPSVQRDADQSLIRWTKGDDIVQSLHFRVPRAMLPMLGVPIIEPDAAGIVRVEMLLGNDGLARTIRIVP